MNKKNFQSHKNKKKVSEIIESIRSRYFDLTPNRFLQLKGLKYSAVLIILTVIDETIKIVFTHRTEKVNSHKDQVSFPGGVKEKNDPDLIYTALRETEEEIGIRIPRSSIIGKLPELVTPSGFIVYPFVCFQESLGRETINKNEVKRVFDIPFDWLEDMNNWSYQLIKTDSGKERNVIVYKPYKGEIVWGITAEILTDLFY